MPLHLLNKVAILARLQHFRTAAIRISFDLVILCVAGVHSGKAADSVVRALLFVVGIVDVLQEVVDLSVFVFQLLDDVADFDELGLRLFWSLLCVLLAFIYLVQVDEGGFRGAYFACDVELAISLPLFAQVVEEPVCVPPEAFGIRVNL